MGYFSCNSESSIIACDPYNWDTNKGSFKKKKKKKKKKSDYKVRCFSYTDLEIATNGFSPKCFLGKGSHGSVYKAVLNKGKSIVAVKKSTTSDKRNPNSVSSTLSPGENEIEILSRIQNPRFVNLLGYSFDSSENNRLIVVEYMPNGSLYDHLHLNPNPLNWAKRVRFALQIARAVEFLHSSNPPVIHRDIKSSNVLIDGDWNARLGDFGLALRGHVEDVRMKSTPPAGTLGYLDPGYVAPGDVSAKSDVFSFGILLLEIVSGRNAIDVNYSPPFVVDWALPLIKHGEFVAICDSQIDPPDDLSIVQQLGMLAVKCVRSIAEKRPSMGEVVECLTIVHKKVPSPMWKNFQRQTRQPSQSSPALSWIEQEKFDDSKEVVQSTGNRRVSSIQLSLSVEFGKEVNNKVNVRVRRSNSVGSIREVIRGSDGLVNNQRRRSAISFKMPSVKLNKSRSLGMLQSLRPAHGKEKDLVLHLLKNPQLKELDMSRLVISVDQAIESKIAERKQSS